LLILAPLSCAGEVAGLQAGTNIVGVALSSTSLVLTAGQSVTLTATALDATGRPTTFRGSWSSSVGTIAAVSPTGAVLALAAGYATITATMNGYTASASVTVNSPSPVP